MTMWWTIATCAFALVSVANLVLTRRALRRIRETAARIHATVGDATARDATARDVTAYTSPEEYRALMAGRPGPVVAGPDRCPPNIPLTPTQGRCMRCGAEAWPSGGLMHRDDCPNAQERP